MDIQNLEIYRKIYLNNVEIPRNLIDGEITVAFEENATTTLSFTLFNDDSAIPAVPIPPAPRKIIKTLIGARVSFVGGYNVPNGYTKLFSGRINEVSPKFGDDGRISVSIGCKSSAYNLAKDKRSEVYPVFGKTVAGKTPTGKTEPVGPEAEKPSRSWAVVTKGQSLKLSTIITNLAIDAGLEVGQVLVETRDKDNNVTEPTFDGIKNELHQKDMSDWKFLQKLAHKYGCQVWIDEDSEKFYFVSKEALKNEVLPESISKEPNSQITGVHFYYHRYDMSKPRYIAPITQMKPWLPDTSLPMRSINYNYDASSGMSGGQVEQYTDLDGNLTLVSSTQDDDGKIAYERLTIKKEMLNTPEADQFLKNFSLGSTTWEETKKFWNISTEPEQTNSSQPTSKMPYYETDPSQGGGPNLEFETYGNIYVRKHASYYVYNLGFGIEKETGLDRWKHNVIAMTHKFGEIYSMTVSMRVH